MISVHAESEMPDTLLEGPAAEEPTARWPPLHLARTVYRMTEARSQN